MTNDKTEQVIEGVELIRKGYTMIVDAYDDVDMMEYPFPVDYQKLSALVHLGERRIIESLKQNKNNKENSKSVYQPNDSHRRRMDNRD